MRALLTGWCSFTDGETTGGDVLALEAVSAALRSAAIAYDTAWSPMFRPGGFRLEDARPERTPGHLRRRVLAAAGRSDGAQAGPEAVSAALVRRERPDRLRRAVQMGTGFFSAGSTPTAKFAGQVQIVREALAETGRPAADFPIAKRVYIAIADDPGYARKRINTELERLYGHLSPDVEAAAITGRPADCVRQVREVAEAGAELILFTALFEEAEHAERVAADVIPGSWAEPVRRQSPGPGRVEQGVSE